MAYGNGPGSMNTPANPFSSAANARMALDNLIRRELRVSDPNDPAQVAAALMSRYAADPKAVAIKQEASGLPFLQQATYTAPAQAVQTSSDMELKQAVDDVEQDLKELTTSSILKDITPELMGWARGIRSAVTAGVAAARQALDPRQRDRVFALRRQLGDFARMARLVGTFTPSVNSQFRGLAQSLDEVASVMLVMTGEALANVGFKSGVNLLQVHYSELAARRDTILLALRNFIGTTQVMGGNSEWPRGLDAYRRVIRQLDATGHSDLRSLFQENELARTLDNLVEQAADGTIHGMRGLSSTAEVDLARFRRLIMVSHPLADPESPPFAAFLESLQLFIDAFTHSGGIRLLRVARPPILFYGLYGGTTNDGEAILTTLLLKRGALASAADCIAQCGCDPISIQNQIMADLAIYCTDRAIDLYCLGDVFPSDREYRATAYAYMLDQMTDVGYFVPTAGVEVYATVLGLLQDIQSELEKSGWLVAIATPGADVAELKSLLIEELAMQRCTEERWLQLLPAWTSGCKVLSTYFGDPNPDTTSTYMLLGNTIAVLNALAVGTTVTSVEVPSCDFVIDIPPTVETSLATP